MERRQFLLMSMGLVWVSGCGENGSISMPTAPTAPQSPAAPPSQYPLQAWWGERIGEMKTAGVSGTLPEVMRAARLDPVLTSSGLLVSFNGVAPPRGIVLLVRGEYFHHNINNVHLSPGDTWAAYHWSGRTSA